MECVSGVDYLLYTSPCVYTWKDQDGVVLYVGMSTVGLSRPIGTHHVINVARPVEPTDTFLIEWFSDESKAAHREKELIATLYPKFNKSGSLEVEWLRQQEDQCESSKRTERSVFVEDPRSVRCKNCGGLYVPKRKWQRFCTDKCRTTFFVENTKRQTASAEAIR